MVEHVSAQNDVEVPSKKTMAKDVTHIFMAIYMNKTP
jgi:hypothetical protein